MRGTEFAQTSQRERVDRLLASARLALASTDPLPSPCTSVCRMCSETALCEGCYRTLDEIVAWSRISDEGENGKRSIWSRISQRANFAIS
jgi:predicted Fe-S protein YdhL (DUF1289 family)